MSLTVIFSIAQIVIVSVFLWFLKEIDLKKFLYLTVLPFLIVLFYFSQALKFQFWFRTSPINLIFENVPLEHGLLILIYLVFIFLNLWKIKIKSNPNYSQYSFKDSKNYLILTILMFVAAISLLGMLIMHDTRGASGFAIASRYFIFLSPVSIIAVVLFSINLLQAFQSQKWTQVNVAIFLLGLFLSALLNQHDICIKIVDLAFF